MNLLELMHITPKVSIVAMMIACVLPVVFAGLAKYFGGFEGDDNRNPRDFLGGLSGVAARANAVQKNSYESLPMFLAAVITAMLLFVPQFYVNVIACLYVVLRIIYGFAYLLDLALFRSIIWILSFMCIMLLFWSTLSVL